MNSSLRDSLASIGGKLQPLWRYRVLAFIVFVVALCGYEVMQVNSASSVEPTTTASSAPASPHIDPTVVHQLQQLQDNSVSVKALFNQARDNPFQ